MRRLGARLVPVVAKIKGGGMRALADGRILLNAEQFEKSASHVDPGMRLDFQISAYIEELAHHSHNLAFPRNRKSSETLFKGLGIELRGLVKTAYGRGYLAADEAAGLGGEALRMFVQVRCGFPLTESFSKDTSDLEHALVERQSPQVEEAITRVSRMLLRGEGRELRAWGESDSYGLGGVNTEGLLEGGVAGRMEEDAGAGSDSRSTNSHAGTPPEPTASKAPFSSVATPTAVSPKIPAPPAASPAPSPRTLAPASRAPEWGGIDPARDGNATSETQDGRTGRVTAVKKVVVKFTMPDGTKSATKISNARVIASALKGGDASAIAKASKQDYEINREADESKGGEGSSRSQQAQLGAGDSAAAAGDGKAREDVSGAGYSDERSPVVLQQLTKGKESHAALYRASGATLEERHGIEGGGVSYDMVTNTVVFDPAKVVEQQSIVQSRGLDPEKWLYKVIEEEGFHGDVEYSLSQISRVGVAPVYPCAILITSGPSKEVRRSCGD